MMLSILMKSLMMPLKFWETKGAFKQHTNIHVLNVLKHIALQLMLLMMHLLNTPAI